MEFINMNVPTKIRIGEANDCHWATINKGQTVELPKELGLHYGFSVKTTEGQIGNKKVETKQIETTNNTDKITDNLLKELIKIKGIGKKTAKDITKIFPVREELIKTIRRTAYTKNALPFRDDISKILEETYGQK